MLGDDFQYDLGSIGDCYIDLFFLMVLPLCLSRVDGCRFDPKYHGSVSKTGIERLRANLADFVRNILRIQENVYQDVTCDLSIKTILVQILEKFFVEIGQVFPQPLYRLSVSSF